MNANQFLKAVSQLQGWRECAFLLALANRRSKELDLNLAWFRK